VRGLIGTIGYKGVYIRELLYNSIVNIIKRNAVVNIAGGNFHFQNDTVYITNGVRLIGHLFFVVAFHKQTAIRVCSADSYRFLLRFLFALFQLLLRGVVTLFLGRSWRFGSIIIVMVVLKRLLTVSHSVSIHFIHKFLDITLCNHRNFHFY